MWVTVNAHHGTNVLGHSGDFHHTKIRTVVDDPTVQIISRFIPILNPVVLFEFEASVSGKRVRRQRNRWQKHMAWRRLQTSWKTEVPWSSRIGQPPKAGIE